MNWFLWILLSLLLLYFIRQSLPVKGVKNISTAELKSMLAETGHHNRQFVDVRTPMEFQLSNLNAFQNLPIQDLRKQYTELDKEKEVVLICCSGSRSMQAARILKNKGFTKLTNVAGGLNHWN